MSDQPSLPTHLRLSLDRSIQFGPGKANLLEAIEKSGSIAAAGRAMRMSYKRAWSLVEQLNAAFAEPLVVVSRGGSRKGGASLTETGREVLVRYRAMQAASEAAIAEDLAALRALVRVDMSGEK